MQRPRNRRSRNRAEALRERCAGASRLVELHAASHARARARALAEPESREALEQLDAAEELHYLAVYELRHARRALRRREAFDAFIARWTPGPSPARARRH
jgi:hypothetical protein